MSASNRGSWCRSTTIAGGAAQTLTVPARARRRIAYHVTWRKKMLGGPSAAVFAFDGILIGAGDSRFLAGAMTAAAPPPVPARMP